jgi:hypothetical protein
MLLTANCSASQKMCLLTCVFVIVKINKIGYGEVSATDHICLKLKLLISMSHHCYLSPNTYQA